ncbi:MAG TPA: c-type cytochrome [Terriglobia bacterium]|nr:c-type cytochrome [Terriglobia bacterium]
MNSAILRQWKTKGWVCLAVFAGITFLLAASWTVAAGKSKEEGPAARLSEAPLSAQSLRNPFAGDEKAAAAGHKLFEQHCASCHGADGRGLGHAANLHAPAVQNAPAGVLFWALRNGRIRKGMPSWSHLPDEQLWQLVTYLKTLKDER